MKARDLAACGVLWITGALAAGAQMATDQALTLIYPTGHWTGMQSVNFYGTESAPFDTPVKQMGWWYRIEGDPYERPLPPPNRRSSSGAQFVAEWDDVHGRGFRLSETVRLFDNEGPSGGLSSTLQAENLGASPKTVQLFFFVHVGAGGTFSDDVARMRHHGFIEFTDDLKGDVVRAHVHNADRYQIGAFPAIRSLLLDARPTDLNFTGSPFGPGHAEAAFQKRAVLQPAVPALAAEAWVTSRLASDYSRGAYRGHTYPGLITLDAAAGRYYARSFRRTTQLEAYHIANSTYSRLEAYDDFYGLGVPALLLFNTATGKWQINSGPISGGPARGPEWQLASTGDFDGNGRSDLLWRNTTTQKLEVWILNGNSYVATRVPNPSQATDASWAVAGTADFDGDGFRDILFRNETSNNLVIWYLDGNQQRLRAAFTNPTSAGAGWRVVAVGDFGKGPSGELYSQDIVWQNDTSKRVVVWHMDRTGVRAAGVFVTPDTLGAGETVIGPR